MDAAPGDAGVTAPDIFDFVAQHTSDEVQSNTFKCLSIHDFWIWHWRSSTFRGLHIISQKLLFGLLHRMYCVKVDANGRNVVTAETGTVKPGDWLAAFDSEIKSTDTAFHTLWTACTVKIQDVPRKKREPLPVSKPVPMVRSKQVSKTSTKSSQQKKKKKKRSRAPHGSLSSSTKAKKRKVVVPSNPVVRIASILNPSQCVPVEEARLRNIAVGLKQLGQTCYMNASLQCLSSVRRLELAMSTVLRTFRASESMSLHMSDKLRGKFNVMLLWHSALRSIRRNSGKAISLDLSLLHSRQEAPFCGNRQQDGGDYVRHLLSGVSEVADFVRSANPIDDLFQFKTLERGHCGACGHDTYEETLHIMLMILEFAVDKTVEELLALKYGKQEERAERQCIECKAKGKSTYSLMLPLQRDLPQRLVIALYNYLMDGRKYHTVNLSSFAIK